MSQPSALRDRRAKAIADAKPRIGQEFSREAGAAPKRREKRGRARTCEWGRSGAGQLVRAARVESAHRRSRLSEIAMRDQRDAGGDDQQDHGWQLSEREQHGSHERNDERKDVRSDSHAEVLATFRCLR